MERRWSAGETIQDLCRPCGMVRRHTVLATPVADRPARVLCDHCGSQHNYRGGDRGQVASPRPGPGSGPGISSAARVTQAPLNAVSDRELTTGGDETPLEELDVTSADLERMLRKVIREETGLSPVAIGERWRGGEVVLKPGRDGVQEKTIPIETFFNKLVMLRNRIRTLEQQVNSSDLSTETKAKIHGYITGCYGSLTTFNVLFADEDDRFKGSGGKS